MVRRLTSRLVTGVALAAAGLGVGAVVSIPLGNISAKINPSVDVENLEPTSMGTRRVSMTNLVSFDYNASTVVLRFDTTGNGIDNAALLYESERSDEGVIFVSKLIWMSVDINGDNFYESSEMISREHFKRRKGFFDYLRAVTKKGPTMTFRFDRDKNNREDLAFYYSFTGNADKGFSTRLIAIADDHDRNGEYGNDEVTLYPIRGSGM